MTASKENYSLAYEAWVSFLKGCTITVLISLVLLFVYSLFDFYIIQNIHHFIQNADAWDPWLSEVKRNWNIIAFAAVMFFVVGFLQFIFIALPISSRISKGLETDSSRSSRFYITSGALIACLPWVIIVLVVILLEKLPWQALASLPFSISPILLTGLLSGAILKKRLKKLVIGSSIEISIK